MSAKITTEQNENCKFSKNVLIDGKCIGSVMADNSMSAFDCYESLKNNWAIDDLECQNDLQIDRNGNY